jgi:TolB protein
LTTGTPTPLPANSVRATPTPSPTPIPLVLYFDQLPPTASPTPTPLIPAAMPAELVGKILFVSDRDRAPALLALDPANGRLAYITQNWPYALAASKEANAPDGHQSAFVQNDNVGVPHIFVRDNAYQGARQITNGKFWTYDVAWSPLGDRLAFVSQEPGNDEIYTIAPDGSAPRRLTSNNWEWDKHPSWSPDGKQIVFWSNRATGRRQLWVMNADGSNQRPLMDSAYNDWDPIWVK